MSDRKPALTDSPWLWLAVFCTAALLFLLVIWPQYAARQRRLEMQFMARQEIVRRQAAGEAPARAPGQEGEAPPPVLGQLIIPIWPLGIVFSLLLAVAGYFLWKSRRGPPRAEPPPEGAP